MEPALVFVYGTLRRGGSNAFRMDGAEFIASGTVRGNLYAISWFPGIVLDPGAGTVMGDLYRVPAAQLAALDAFEGADYRRVETAVDIGDGRNLTAFLWEWLHPVEGRGHITGGDWLEHTGD